MAKGYYQTNLRSHWLLLIFLNDNTKSFKYLKTSPKIISLAVLHYVLPAEFLPS